MLLLPTGLAVGVDWAATTPDAIALDAGPDPPAPKDKGDSSAAMADPGSTFGGAAAATGGATGAGAATGGGG